MNRRDLIITAACAGSLAIAEGFRPRKNVSLLGSSALADVLPASFGDWRSQDVGDPLAVNGEGTLAAELYNELVVRVYRNLTTSAEVLALFAYGRRQTDELQLHRPEVCYPAFGFELVRNEAFALRLADRADLPTRRLFAEGSSHQESILYWSRMGEHLPTSGGSQRQARLQIAMSGIIPDGLLCRFSTNTDQPAQGWSRLEAFIPDLIRAVPVQHRRVLVGTQIADALVG